MNTESFLIRHIGPRDEDIKKMKREAEENAEVDRKTKEEADLIVYYTTKKSEAGYKPK